MLSIIVPTYNAPEYLERAIQSVLCQTSPNWELIICPDDGKDYTHLTKTDNRIQIASSKLVATGPVQARRRGLELVTGTAIAYFDDDDQLSSTYVESALLAMESVPAVLFPTTYITDTGITIRTIGTKLTTMSIEQFSQELGSLHVVAKKEYFPSWIECFAEDVVHTCEVIERLGNSIQVIQSAYYIATVRTGSICTTTIDIDSAYQELIDTIACPATKDLFKFRQLIDKSYNLNNYGKSYHEFVKHLYAD